MDKTVPYLYKEYGKYVNSSRSFPLDIDGLKPVERRVLLSTFQIAREKLVKSARVDGFVIGHFSPHGTAYGTISQLVRQGFLEGQGNFGTSIGVEPLGPAASRYTECRLTKRTLEMAFRYIKYVPWVESELDDEPQYIPTMFPFCLIGTEYTQGIGFGYKTYIPCYKVEDLHKRLLYLLKIRKTKPTIKPVTDCTILATDAELETLLTTGKASIEVQGVIKTIPLSSKVILKSWPPGRKFQSYLSKFDKELDNQDIGFIDLSTERVGTEIEFEVLKQRNKVAIFKKFVVKLKESVKGNIPFDTIVVDLNGNVKNISIDELLMNTFTAFIEVNKQMLNSEIAKCQEIINEYNVINKIRPFISQQITSKIFDIEAAIKNISALSKVAPEIIKEILTKYRISKLFTLNTDTSSVADKMNKYKENLKDIQTYVLEQYKEVV